MTVIPSAPTHCQHTAAMKTGLCFGGVYVRWHKQVTICGDEGSEGDCSRQQGDGRGYFTQGAEGGVPSEEVAFKQMCESSPRLIL